MGFNLLNEQKYGDAVIHFKNCLKIYLSQNFDNKENIAVEPKKRGRKPKVKEQSETTPRRPRGRPRKVIVSQNTEN